MEDDLGLRRREFALEPSRFTDVAEDVVEEPERLRIPGAPVGDQRGLVPVDERDPLRPKPDEEGRQRAAERAPARWRGGTAPSPPPLEPPPPVIRTRRPPRRSCNSSTEGTGSRRSSTCCQSNESAGIRRRTGGGSAADSANARSIER